MAVFKSFHLIWPLLEILMSVLFKIVRVKASGIKMYSGSAPMLRGSAVSMATHRPVRGKADAFSSDSESLQIQTITLTKIQLKISVYKRGGNNVNC